MKDKKQDEIRKKNEEMKDRISNEFGGQMGTNPDLPPEIENQFLKNVLAFEEQFTNGKETSVFHRIGKPVWTPADDLNDQEITRELQLINNLLHQNGIRLTTICETEEREIYRFITEELFEQQVLEFGIPGMVTGFIYEEFHPNHAYDVEETSRMFIFQILSKKMTENHRMLEGLKTNLSPAIDGESAARNVINFNNSWDSMTVEKFDVTEVKVAEDEQTATMKFNIAYDATLEKSREVVSFEGMGHIKLGNVYERLGCFGWEVSSLEMPGFKL